MKKRYFLSALILFCLPAFLFAQDGQGTAVTVLDAEEFSSHPAPNASALIQGLDPALWMNYSSGRASAVGTPSLRGFLSYSGTTPLVLIDGVESSMDRLNPDDIKSITILKDAAAAAVYGARAAAGAIVVSTKDGTGGDSIKATANGGILGSTRDARYYSSARRTASASASAVGGDSNLRYYVGANAYGEDGELDRNYGDNGFGNLSLRANADAKVFKWLRYSLNAHYAYTTEALPYWQGYNVLEEGLDGENAAQYENAMLSGNNFWKSKDHYAVFKNSLEAVFGPDLSAGVSYAFTNEYLFRQKRSSPVEGVSEEIAPNRYLEERGNSRQNYFDAYLCYSHLFEQRHKLSARAGFDFQNSEGKDLDVFVDNLIDPEISALTVGDGSFTIDEDLMNYAQAGVYGTASYSFEGKYFLDATVRGDASSRFSAGNKWAVSPSLSAAWLVSEEPFFDGVKETVNFLKLRYSYSSTANQRVCWLYPYLTILSLDNTAGGWILSRGEALKYSDFAQRGDDNLRWERVRSHDIGLDAAFLGSRLSLEADFFLRNTSDLLSYSRTLSGVYGGVALTNSGTLRTLGTEISLAWSDSVQLGEEPLRYRAGASVAAYDSRISEFPLTMKPDLPDYIPSRLCTFRGEVQWNGLDARLLAYAADLPGYSAIGSVSVGYGFSFPQQFPIRLLRLSLEARNPLFSPECPLPSVVTAGLGVNF